MLSNEVSLSSYKMLKKFVYLNFSLKFEIMKGTKIQYTKKIYDLIQGSI